MSSKNSPSLKSPKIKVGITIGDPAGIGPIITLKALKCLRGLADFTVIGGRRSLQPGRITAEHGGASIGYLDKALELLKKKEIDCLVTCPISKEAINKAGIHYSGHTEYLKERIGAKDIAMLLLNKNLKISLATRHIPLKEVSGRINKEMLYKNILLTHTALKKLFGIKNPRMVACGLNPHASDNGLLGNEENKIIIPALKKARRAGIKINGPLSADVAIACAKEGLYDCVIAMYHDQALIPLKLTDKFSGVNMTLGLPFVRTSPLHGTAFDIAKKPHLANPDSLIAAIKLAIKCTARLKKA